jgi:hypothetical protein
MNYREFWENGFHVFGLHGANKKGQCGCGNPDCQAAYKHPLVSNWQHTPHWSDEQIQVMEETGQFDTGYGVLIRGGLVIDIDARNGGVDSLALLANDFPSLKQVGLVVKTGSGGGSRHFYFKLPEEMALVQHLDQYPGIDFKSSGYVVGPGSLHASGNRYEVSFGSVDQIEDAPDDIIALLRKPDRHRAVIDGLTVDVSHQELADMLACIDPDADHDTWVKCGMAIHHASNGTAFDVWDKWSARGTKYPGSDTLYKRWHSFGKASNPVTLGTLKHHAEQGGWLEPVTFTPNEEIEATEVSDNDSEIDINGIDLKRPPGFVGEVVAFVNSQCRYPRENLAVAAALTSVGNIVGLRYEDDLHNVTTNLFTFCVAGSGTGKEAIQQAALAIHRAANIAPAVHGNIKSEQEILRNLTDHQAAYYIIDEIGIMLRKIKNAQQKGGAAYLDGVIGMLMSVYSKANGWLPVTGDMRKEVRKSLLQELQHIERKLEDKPNSILEDRVAAIEYAIKGLENGIEKPFLSLMGFTTPVMFDELVDYESATNGFIGRSLLFNERETVPVGKKKFVRPPMDPRLGLALAALYSAGSYDTAEGKRIEHYGEKLTIPTNDDAEIMLEQLHDLFHEMALEHKDTNGLETLALRAKEAVAKVSFILAVPEGIRTVEHVRWAYALVKRDVDEKTRLVIGNDRRKDSPAQALMARILNLVAGDQGETLGVLVNRIKNVKKEDIQKCLDLMIKEKMIVMHETVHPRKKIVSKRYKMV